MSETYWTVKYKNRYLDPTGISYLRRDAIAKYLSAWKNSPLFGDKDWRWHKRNKGVSVVRVRIEEVA